MGCLCSKPSLTLFRDDSPIPSRMSMASQRLVTHGVMETRERDSSSQQPLRTVLSARGGVDVHPPRNPITALLGSCISPREQYGEFHSSRKNMCVLQHCNPRTFPGFSCCVVLLLLLCSTSFVFTIPSYRCIQRGE